MPIRITGMNSGLDTEALVSELVSAYRKKTEKYTKAQTKLTWKQDAWKSLSAKTYSFRNGLDKMRFSSFYKLKTTSVSNSTKATVTAGNNAVNGSQSLNITSLAKSGYLTGGVLKRTDGKAVTGATTLAALKDFAGNDGKVSLNGKEITLRGDMTVNDVISKFNDAGVTASFDETNQRIFVNSNESGAANDFELGALSSDGTNALKALGLYVKSSSTTEMYKAYETVNAEYEKYVADETAAGNTGYLSRTDWIQEKLDNYVKSADTVAKANDAEGYLDRAVAYQDALKKMSDIKSSYIDGKPNANTQLKLLEDGRSFIGGNTIYSLDDEGYYTGNGHKYVLDTKVEGDKVTTQLKAVGVPEGQPGGVVTVISADDYLKEHAFKDVDEADEIIAEYRSAQATKDSFEADVQAEKDAYDSRVEALTKELYGDGSTITEQEARAQAKAQADAELKPSGTYADWRSLESVQGMTAQEIADAKTKISTERDEGQKFLEENAFFASYARKYAAAADDAERKVVAEEVNDDFDYALKALDDEKNGIADYNTDAVRINGQDATIYLNGAKFTSSSNTFNINGLTINALATTTTDDKIGTDEADASAITITTATDNQGIYDKIKDFLGEYNNLINAMTGSYNAEKASEYEPLTDDEREAMTDSQIEKWEEKGKSAVLRRDSTLSALMSTLTTAMSKSYEINGKKYSLSTFGIKTLGILNADKNEHNAYHIDGDEDDESTSGNTDKLMAAIIEDPDAVTEFFQRLSNDLSDDLSKKMSSTTMRTYGTFYNDKEMAKEYSDYTTTIAKWEQKLADIEESYYKKFAAMEKALATLQSQSSQLAGLLGM